MDHMTQSEITVFTLFYTFLDGNCFTLYHFNAYERGEDAFKGVKGHTFLAKVFQIVFLRVFLG